MTGSPTLNLLEDWPATARGWVATSGQKHQTGPGEEAVQKKAQVERTAALTVAAGTGVLAGGLAGELAEGLAAAADHASGPRPSEQPAQCH